MSALIQSFSSLSLSSRTLRGDAKVASPSTRAMPKNRTAVVTEAVRCFFLFFWALPPIFFLHFAVVVVFFVAVLYYTTRESREYRLAGLSFFLRERDSFAFDSVARRRLCSSRRYWWWSSSVARGNFFFRPRKILSEREKFFLSLQVFAAKKTSLSLFCVCQRQKIY